MNTLQDFKLSKIEENSKRVKYLKYISIICLTIDLFSTVLFETIEFTFSHFLTYQIILYIFKIVLFIGLINLIGLAVHFDKKMLLNVFVTLYLIIGLIFFLYLIIQELDIMNESMRPIVDAKSELYYTVFIKIILICNILSGTMRILASIFLFLYNKRYTKTIKLKKEHGLLSSITKEEIHSHNPHVLNNTNSMTESYTVTPMKTALNKNNTKKENIKPRKNQDVNIYVVNNEKGSKNVVKNVYVNVYNYNCAEESDEKTEKKTRRADTLESNDYVIDDYMDNKYDSPKASIIE